MKHINFIFFATILILSCASRSDKSIDVPTNPISKINDTLREKYTVINDFLETKIKDRSKKIMIHSKKINTNMTLKILRLNEIYALDSIDSKKNYEDKTFYKEVDWEIARKKYSKNSVAEIENATFRGGECCWVTENFNYKNFIFEELDFGTPAYEKKYFFGLNDYGYEFEGFDISEPIYYQNKEYLIFTFSHGSVFPPLEYATRIIIYKKKNDKWVQTHIGVPNWIS
ncbi:hypothetical protein [Flavobacterium sp. GNP002]